MCVRDDGVDTEPRVGLRDKHPWQLQYNATLLSSSKIQDVTTWLHYSRPFTMETENQHKQPFLDVSLDNSYHKITLSVYIKPTHSD